MTNYSDAIKEYKILVVWLSRINHSAASSLEEADGETLTVIKLKTPEKLRKTLLSTNPIESAFSKVRSQSGRVKNWKSGANQVSRWAAATLMETEKKFRTIQGYREIPKLISELENLNVENNQQVA